MKVLVPSPLFDYTGQRREVQAWGRSLGQLLLDLDRQYPGIRFRMIDETDAVRAHIKFFVNGQLTRDLAAPLTPDCTLMIVAALSGG